MDQDVLISSQSTSTSRVNRKHFTDCRSDSKRNKIALLSKGVHAEWTNTAWLKVKSIVIGVVVGVCVTDIGHSTAETRKHSIHTADTLFNRLHATPNIPFPKLGAAKQITRTQSELKKSPLGFPILSRLSSHSVLLNSNGNAELKTTPEKGKHQVKLIKGAEDPPIQPQPLVLAPLNPNSHSEGQNQGKDSTSPSPSNSSSICQRIGIWRTKWSR
ncbi:hypothetical protein BLNAU_17784 [Blattamonas nauphoetae]|uniref:Uncharacterized protein n=1 Tax=Blattamonas nauphoetae TaxID=2049346 RepID=A0ABQ9X6S6_9EUKA|nr:hypothetical protein BLNAU_17784 [Blattamonas nauphoetae]